MKSTSKSHREVLIVAGWKICAMSLVCLYTLGTTEFKSIVADLIVLRGHAGELLDVAKAADARAGAPSPSDSGVKP
jgi:hypothetical protein